MSRTDMITIRISPEERLLYEAEAAYRKQSLSAYLRERLEKRETPSHGVPENVTQPSSHEQGVLLEILLLLRYLSTPEKMLLVQKELSRLNIPVWQGDNFPGGSKHAT
jgi:hypothetical protein